MVWKVSSAGTIDWDQRLIGTPTTRIGYWQCELSREAFVGRRADLKIRKTITGADTGESKPLLKMLGHYLQDLSFRSPSAPKSLTERRRPKIGIAANVDARPLERSGGKASGPANFKVTLHLEVKAEINGQLLFSIDLLYGGVFQFENIPEQAFHPMVLIECPSMLFPHARQILSDATRLGGFQPLLLDPVDFEEMYKKKFTEAVEPAVKGAKRKRSGK